MDPFQESEENQEELRWSHQGLNLKGRKAPRFTCTLEMNVQEALTIMKLSSLTQNLIKAKFTHAYNGVHWWPSQWRIGLHCSTHCRFDLGQEFPLKKETHSSILVWEIPWTEKFVRLESTGSQRVGHNWLTLSHFLFWTYFTLMDSRSIHISANGTISFLFMACVHKCLQHDWVSLQLCWSYRSFSGIDRQVNASKVK